jgi:hypothetical protein
MFVRDLLKNCKNRVKYEVEGKNCELSIILSWIKFVYIGFHIRPAPGEGAWLFHLERD